MFKITKTYILKHKVLRRLNICKTVLTVVTQERKGKSKQKKIWKLIGTERNCKITTNMLSAVSKIDFLS